MHSSSAVAVAAVLTAVAVAVAVHSNQFLDTSSLQAMSSQ
jgi:hypothetical protein